MHLVMLVESVYKKVINGNRLHFMYDSKLLQYLE
jgi:hypothetical protein